MSQRVLYVEMQTLVYKAIFSKYHQIKYEYMEKYQNIWLNVYDRWTYGTEDATICYGGR